ncbi:hypothetical protein Tco_0023201 [Tanacetum coccineum]
MALWKSQREEHTSDWLRAVPISRLGQTMNGKTYHCVLCYRLGVPLFYASKPCSACSKVFTRDVYGDHVVSCAGVIGIKHRQNAVRDTLVDICFWLGISAGKEVDIGLGGGCDKALRPTDIFLPFSISSFGKLEKDAVTLLKWSKIFLWLKILGPDA